ncbi:uncharacterized protein LOC110037637 [Phalaenopsis equestris]|uniref:uncharacterized protein LOC110037637 n=1 Tax=Phalaenopsis equestris TaxID=78828 RepID=UPI0009E416B0|nr:uncharacterized protein LOC110037637 [Phalaenopsis equestris]
MALPLLSMLGALPLLLWQQLHDFSNSMRDFWFIGGDFNCLSSPNEKKGGRSPDTNLMNLFNDNIQYAGLYYLGFTGPKYTWRWGRIWERLDRIVWNWEVVGNIDSKVLEAEKKVLNIEHLLVNGSGSETDLRSANEQFMEAISMQEEFYAQMSNRIKFCEGDRNSKYYHACINYRRKCNTIHKITTKDGKLITSTAGIALNVVQYFQEIFKQPPIPKSSIQCTLFAKKKGVHSKPFTH